MPREDEPQISDVEWLDIGGGVGVDDNGPPPVDGGMGRRRWPRWTPIAVALAVVLVVTLIVAKQGSRKHSASPSTQPAPTSSARQRPTRRPPRVTFSSAPVPSVVVTNLGHPLLGISAAYELFGRGPDAVVRIQPALGRITRTTVPGLSSNGPASFLVGPNRAIVHPLDTVAGYAVPDGRPAVVLPDSMNEGGIALPGPDPSHVWLESDTANHQAMRLVGFDGRPTSVSITIPNNFGQTMSDGSGYLAVTGIGGVYDARPDGWNRITNGILLAAGSTRWLTVECDDHATCSTVVRERSTGARRVLGRAPSFVASPGVISPDGSMAATLPQIAADASNPRVHLIDLQTGRDIRLAVAVSQDISFDSSATVWSPDGQWLFVASTTGSIVAVDAATQSVHDLSVRIPRVTQLAIRPAPH